MNAQNRKRQRPAAPEEEQQQEEEQELQEQEHDNDDQDNDDQDNDHNSIAATETFTDFDLEGSSTNGINGGNGNEMEAFTWKWRMSALEAKNKMLEGQNQMLQGKLESQEFQAKIRAMTEGSSVEKFKEENRALLKRLKEVEDKEKIANNKLKKILQVIQQNTAEENAKMVKELSAPIPMDGREQPQQHQKLQEHQKLQQHQNQQQEYVQRAVKQKDKSYKEDDEDYEEEESEEEEEEEGEEEEEEEAGEDGEDEDKTGYEVEDILNRKTFLNGQEKYFIKWKGYGSEYNTWEPTEGLQHLDVFKEYMAKQKGATGKMGENEKGNEAGMPKGMPKGRPKGMPKGTKKKFKGKRMEYFVKWRGYDASRNTWEPRSNLAHLNVFKAYERNYKYAAGNSGLPTETSTSTSAAAAVGSPKKKGRPSTSMMIKRPSSAQSQLSTISAMFAENGGENGPTEKSNLNSSGNGK